jgi:hypothetical protein
MEIVEILKPSPYSSKEKNITKKTKKKNKKKQKTHEKANSKQVTTIKKNSKN